MEYELYDFLVDTYQAIKNFKKLPYYEINLIGGRQFGKTFPLAKFIGLVLSTCQKVSFAIVRKTSQDVFETWNEILANLPPNFDNESINKTHRTITLPKQHNYLRCYHLNDSFIGKNGRRGYFTPPECMYNIRIEDEADELSELQEQQFLIGTRVGKEISRLTIRASNPNIASNWYVSKCLKYLPEDRQVLETDGWQKYNKNGVIVFRANYRINPYIPQEAINDIEKLKNRSPETWKVASLGLAGNYEGGCYTASLPHMRSFNPLNFGQIRIGIDWGDSTQEEGGDTSVEVCRYNPITKQIDFIDEYYINNALNLWTAQEIISHVVKFCGQFLKQQEFIECWVDNASFTGFFMLFNEEAQKQNLNGLNFKPVTSGLKNNVNIQTRITIFNYLINSQLLGVSDKCIELWNSLHNCYYEPVKNWKEEQELKRSHDYTHAINGAEYALITELLNIIESDGIEWLLLK